jgi:hypothetical protein
MATQTTVIEVDIQGTAKVESMRTQMRKLREELATLPEGTAEFTRVQKQLGELKDKMDDLGKSVNTMSGEPLERLNNSFGMIGSSILSLDFGAAQTGIQGVSSAMKDFKFKDLSTAAKGFGGTMLDLGKSLIMNPIFAIAGILILIITNFEKLTKAGGLVGKIFGFIGDQIAMVKDGIISFLNYTGIIDTQAEERVEAAKKRVEELKKLNEEVDKFLDSQTKKRLTSNMSAREKEIYDLKQQYGKLIDEAKNYGQSTNELEQSYKKDLALINDKYNEQEAEKRKTANEKRKAEAEKNKQEKERELKEEYDKAVKQQQLLDDIKREAANEEEALAQEIQNIKQGIQATELQKVQDEYFEKIELAKKYGLDFTALEEELKTKQAEINAKYRKTEAVAIQEEVKLTKLTQDQKYEIYKATIDGMMGLNDLLTATNILNAEQSFKIGKALSLAQATVSAIEGTQNAFKSAQASPITSVFPAYPFIMAGSAAAVGAANIAKIAATKFNANGSSGGGGNLKPSGGMGAGGMGGGSTNAPALDLSFVNNQTNQPQPLQTYVLATNVSSAQEAQQKIKDQSKIIK